MGVPMRLVEVDSGLCNVSTIFNANNASRHARELLQIDKIAQQKDALSLPATLDIEILEIRVAQQNLETPAKDQLQ